MYIYRVVITNTWITSHFYPTTCITQREFDHGNTLLMAENIHVQSGAEKKWIIMRSVNIMYANCCSTMVSLL